MQAILLDPPQMYAALDNVAFVKTHLHKSKVMLLSLMAGFFLAVGAQAFICVTAPTTTPALTVLGAFVFSYCLIAIVHCGAELFTGNCLMLMAVFQGHIPLIDVLIEWGLVWSFNFLGTIFFAILMYGTGVNGYYTELTNNGLRLCAVAVYKANERPYEMFFRGVFANFCVCSAVLLGIASKSAIGKQFGIAWPLVVFIVCGFDHSIANMYTFAEATLLACDVKNHGYYWLNLALCSVGNIFGASILAGTYWFCYLRVNPDPNDASPKLAPYGKA